MVRPEFQSLRDFVRYAATLNPIPRSEGGQTELRIAFHRGEIPEVQLIAAALADGDSVL